MQSKIFFILILTLLTFNCKKEESNPEMELDKIISKFNSHSSISYDLSYRIKYFDYADTTNIFSKAIIIKEEKDSLFGGYIWFSRKDSINDYIKYYDLKSFYVINNITKVVTIYNPEKPIPYGFKNNFDGKLLKTYFLKQSSLKTLVKDSTFKSKVINENSSLKLKILYPDEVEVVNQVKEIFFDKSSSAITKIIFKAELDNLQEYNEWNLKNINFNNVKAEDLELKFQTITKDYVFIDYQPTSTESNLPLNIGQKAIEFKGNYLTKSNSEFNLSDFSNNVIILDFWFRTCPPCIKSIPQLNIIYEKYESKGLKLFGINNIDTDSISKDLLISLCKKENINYPIVLTDKSISEKYNVIGYPTFYIINKKGKIEYSKVGYSKNLIKEVDSILNNILN
jgi:thiol-disulfide isomerase/thioredoxin